MRLTALCYAETGKPVPGLSESAPELSPSLCGQMLNTIVKCTPLAVTLGAGPLLKAANMRAIAKFVGTHKGDVLLSSYSNLAKGEPCPLR